jgi:hypothetical protein
MFRTSRKTRGRVQLSAHSDDYLRTTMLAAAGRMQVHVEILFGACLLAFESLDREDQVKAVFTHRIPGKQVNNWNIHVPATELRDRTESWSFPLFKRCEVVRAAMLELLGRPDPEIREWIIELHIFIGDPRQEGT